MTVKNKLKKIDERWANADKWLKRVISIGASLVAIVGAFSATLGWGVNQFYGAVDSRLESVTTIIEDQTQINKEIQLDTMRLQLLFLIEHQGEEAETIMRVGYRYFVELGGDWYMSNLFQHWAEEHDVIVPFELK